jgi:hypothetical protein
LLDDDGALVPVARHIAHPKRTAALQLFTRQARKYLVGRVFPEESRLY